MPDKPESSKPYRNGNGSKFVLDRSSRITVGLLCSVLAGVTLATWQWSEVIHEIHDLRTEITRLHEKRVEEVHRLDLKRDEEIAKLHLRIDEKTSDRWTCTDMKNLRDLFQAWNPTLTVPEVPCK